MYNITGWSGGGRRPLSYNLMPGQFRNTRVNVFQNNTIINNNIGAFGGCYDYGDCGCGGGSNKMSWMDWTIAGSMLLNTLTQIGTCFWGGGGGGGAEKAKADAPDLTSLKADAAAYAKDLNVKIQVLSDGKFLCNGVKYDSLDDLAEAVKDNTNPDGTGGLSEDPRAKEIADLKAQVAALQKAQTKATDAATDEPETFTNLLFKSGTSGLTSTELEESKFKELTGSDPYKITANANSITITKLNDGGGPLPKSVSINLDAAKMATLSTDGASISLGTIDGKAAKATNYKGYLQIQVGDQTYIVGKNNQAYQYSSDANEAASAGYGLKNW